MTTILTPRIYKSNDPGAPVQPVTTQLSLIDVLEAVLVDGYGSGSDLKEPLGWEIHKNLSEDRAVFLPTDTGSKGIGLLVDGDVLITATRNVQTRGIVGFLGWDGDDLIGSPIIFGIGHVTRAGYNAGNIPWCIIGTSRCFYMWNGWTTADTDPPQEAVARIFGPNQSAQGYTAVDSWRSTPWFFGDTSYSELDPYACVLMQSTQSTRTWGSRWQSYMSTIGNPGSSIGMKIAADIAGITTDVNIHVRDQVAYPNAGTPALNIGGRGCPDYPSPVGFYMNPVTVYQSALNMRGYMPGMYYPLVNLIDHSPFFDYMDTIVEDNREFMLLPAAPNSTSVTVDRAKGLILLEIDTNWYPE